MGWAIRAGTAEDIPALVKAVSAGFGAHPSVEHLAGSTDFLEPDRTVVAEDAGLVVAGAGAVTLELTLPGPATVPAAGLTYVSVMPTHRRQGILTGLMARIAADARRRGEPVAVLLASEATIYRRFGYGVATYATQVEIDRVHARMRRPVDLAGRVRMVDVGEMKDVLPPLFDRYRRRRPGEVSRTPGWWGRQLRDIEAFRGGGSARFAVVWDDCGYATYRIHQGWAGGIPGHSLSVEDVVATTPDAYAGLWQYVFGVDLVGTIRTTLGLDDPLRAMLADPRRLRVTAVNDMLWVRLLDVEAALSARTYRTGDRLVLDVLDANDATVAGRYLLAPADGCRRTDAAPDLVLGAADLASAYLGGTSFATLSAAGLVAEVTPGAVARADALFAVAPAPASSTRF